MARRRRVERENWEDTKVLVAEKIKALSEAHFNQRFSRQIFEELGFSQVLKIEPEWDTFEIQHEGGGGYRLTFYEKQGDKDVIRDIRLYGNIEI